MLTQLSTDRLAAGDAFGAFIFADRRCRVGTLFAHDLLLRSEALRRLGFKAAAKADLARAADVDPTDPFISRRLIEAGEEGADAAAYWVVSDPRSSRALIDAAVLLLFERGHPAVGSVTVDGDRLTGWITAREPRALTLRVRWQAGYVDLPLRPRGSDGGRLHYLPVAARLEGPFDQIAVLAEGRVLSGASIGVRSNPAGVHAAGGVTGWDEGAVPGTRSARRQVSVIVPVYDDVDVTRRCLEAVAGQEGGTVAVRVIVVDDASPGSDMQALLSDLCRRHGFDLISNERNLGFIGAVNRALPLASVGDVLLLNSDVVMPPATIAKLAAAAYARPGIGIVNPLTNNGQYDSFPSVAVDNPFEHEERIASIDWNASETVPGVLVETPGGIGYCMYVTRACLDAVGHMPEVYLRGYYEDIEFSLRARERGFATVCAVDTYVGHKGTASFKGEKKRLVARNERAIEVRFPSYEADLAAFRRADPLRPARGAIEARANPIGPAEVVVAGSATYGAALEARSRALEASGRSAVMLRWTVVNGVLGARFQRQNEPEPRQRFYRFDDAGDEQDLVRDVLALRPRRIEVAGPTGVFRPTLAALLQGGLAFGAILCESLGRSATLQQGCARLDEQEPCAACIDNFNANWQSYGVGSDLQQAWQREIAAPAVVVAMDDMAHEVATDLASDAFPNSRFERCSLPSAAFQTAPRTGRPMLALPYPEPSHGTERLLAALATTLLRRNEGWAVVVLGAGVDDRKLMSTGNLFVSGPVRDSEYDDALLHYGATALFAPQRWSGFGLVARLAASLGLPKAYFDWSIGALPAVRDDLSIDPRVCDAKAANAVATWLGGQTSRSAF